MSIQDCIQETITSMRLIKTAVLDSHDTGADGMGYVDACKSPDSVNRSPSAVDYLLVPESGEGFCQVFLLNPYAAVILANLRFSQDTRFILEDPEYKCISYYFSLKATLELPEPAKKSSSRIIQLEPHTLYTNDGLPPGSTTIFSAQYPIHGLIVLISPQEYLSFLQERYGRDISPDVQNLHILNGVRHVPELSVIYDQILNYYGSDFAKQLFMESKLNELIILYLQRVKVLREEPSHSKRIRIKSEDLKYIQKITEYVREHFAETISLSELARTANMSLSKFKYCFKEVNGTSISGFQNHLRMQCAKKLLQTGDLSIKEIALRTGYRNISSFSTAFRKSEGITPTAWRQKHSRPRRT